YRLLICSATRRKDKLHAAFLFSDDLSDKEGLLKTWLILYNEEMQSDFHKHPSPKNIHNDKRTMFEEIFKHYPGGAKHAGLSNSQIF
ncbi:hypothetical protein ACTHRZ_11480, partial [Neisseria sp. P0001.S006]|uniref:hypothetical protein n=1 Tax=Neisseria sp. P0001.S006 TaxID=3436650 RepID=UPI003F7FEB18